jgi:hypothetical protein
VGARERRARRGMWPGEHESKREQDRETERERNIIYRKDNE